MKLVWQLSIILSLFLLSCGESESPAPAKPAPLKDSVINESADTTVSTYTSVDKSPMDMSYFPVDYPKLKMTKNELSPPVARVIYSRPHLQGRQLFHDVLKYGEHWRLGANEATEI